MSPPTRTTCLENRLYHSAYERTMPNDCISKLRAYARACVRVRVFVEICRCGVKFKLLLNHAPNPCYLSEIRSSFVRFVCVLWRTVVTKRPQPRYGPETDISSIYFHDVISMKPVRKNTRSAPGPSPFVVPPPFPIHPNSHPSPCKSEATRPRIILLGECNQANPL